MKLTLQAPKPRNPFVAAGRMRRAGAHRPRSARQVAERELRIELQRLKPSP